jgi:hypothetical protein
VGEGEATGEGEADVTLDSGGVPEADGEGLGEADGTTLSDGGALGPGEGSAPGSADGSPVDDDGVGSPLGEGDGPCAPSPFTVPSGVIPGPASFDGLAAVWPCSALPVSCGRSTAIAPNVNENVKSKNTIKAIIAFFLENTLLYHPFKALRQSGRYGLSFRYYPKTLP